MSLSKEEARELARAVWKRAVERGEARSWFETFYAEAHGDVSRIPWADPEGHPLFVEWLAGRPGDGMRALVVGCGLGEDAEAARRAGYRVTAFDLSSTAIDWCRRIWPDSEVEYRAADLFDAPSEWEEAFDLVVEVYTLQALPPDVREQATAAIARFVKPSGRLLVVTRGRTSDEPAPEDPPWPLTREDLAVFASHGLAELAFETPPRAPDELLPFDAWRVELER